MAKFKKGDLVRCVKPDRYREKNFIVGDIGVVDENYLHAGLFAFEGGYIMEDSRWELATSSPIPFPIPDTVTIGGVEYIRKPEPEHVWKFGDWARHPEYGVGFVCGKQDECYDVQMAFKNYRTEWVNTERLTYISTAEIPA